MRAQDSGGVYERVVDELRRGRKQSHWMWFIFPQVRGLGRSAMGELYAISSLAEARAYIQHPVLGPRLLEVARLVERSPAPSTAQIFGVIDALKLRSSMTLFLHAKPEEPVFKRVLDKYFGGELDQRRKGGFRRQVAALPRCPHLHAGLLQGLSHSFAVTPVSLGQSLAAQAFAVQRYGFLEPIGSNSFLPPGARRCQLGGAAPATVVQVGRNCPNELPALPYLLSPDW